MDSYNPVHLQSLDELRRYERSEEEYEGVVEGIIIPVSSFNPFAQTQFLTILMYNELKGFIR
jgi:hypothetical protein